MSNSDTKKSSSASKSVDPDATGEIATLKLPEQEIQFPILEGSEGEKAIHIGALRKQTGYITLDPGYVNTGSCRSRITFLDGEKGVLRHRGYAIEELAENADFISVAHLLIEGELPNETEYNTYQDSLRKNYALEPELEAIIRAYPKGAHPMAVLSSCLVALSAVYPKMTEVDAETVGMILASVPAIIAYHHRLEQGKEVIPANESLDYCSNFLHMMFGDDEYDMDQRQLLARNLNKLLVVHADHEQNCSTSTARMVSSSGANLFASVAAGVNALWGPLHGGANQAVMEMLEHIRDHEDGDLERTLARAKDKSDPFRLMGFGHRVYKTYDPRARIAKQASQEILPKIGKGERLVKIAIELEELALNDEYFRKRNLYPNVDFYTGIIYRALGLPTKIFTALFAMGRLPGWLSQVVELHQDSERRIGRPRQVYTGLNQRDFVERAKR